MKKRYYALDSLRGITLISMILYHGAWDLVWLFGVSLPWYHTRAAYVWQQSICWTFILLSGFCQPFGKRRWRRALQVFGGGVLLSAVTILFLPENRVLFGVLTLIGSSMILWNLLEKMLRRLPAAAGLGVFFSLFLLFRNVNQGSLGFEGIRLLRLPEGLYHGLFLTWLGFPDPTFYSVDYFSLIPWFFLFLSGYFFNRVLSDRDGLRYLERPRVPGLEWLGRHSLLVYLIHQPILYAVLVLLGKGLGKF